MPDLFDLISRWWKQIAAVILLSLLAVGTITFLKPRQYLSVATAIPASTFAADKGKVFNENIQALYSTLGTPDDLDRIVGTASLDTVYLAVARQFNLYDHYKIKGEGLTERAAARLKAASKVMKSEYGELKIKVWDTDPNLAPQLANAIFDQLQLIHQGLQSAGNETTLRGLIAGKQKLQTAIDSMAASPSEKRNVLQLQAQQYEKLIGEYQLMIDTKPPVLILVEKAKASSRPDKPERVRIMTATAILSLLFALLAALVMDKGKTARQ